MKRIVACFAVAIGSTAAQCGTVGIHLGTAHFGQYGKSMNGENPGLYIDIDGYTAGLYRNSYSKPSAYAGYTVRWANGMLSLTAGAVTGYPRAAISPLLVPSVRVGFSGVFARLSYLPKPHSHGASGMHLSIERDF